MGDVETAEDAVPVGAVALCPQVVCIGLGLGDTTVKVNADPLDSCSWPYVARVAFKVARDNSGQACAVVDEAIASHTKSNRVRVVDITVKGERGA